MDARGCVVVMQIADGLYGLSTLYRWVGLKPRQAEKQQNGPNHRPRAG
jgi:hypothetical protein